MATGLSQFAGQGILNLIFGKASFAMPASLYAALCTAAPSNSSTGASITEATYTGYAREQITAANLTSAAVSGTSGSDQNIAEIDWPVCTAGSSTIDGVAVCDSVSVSSGHMYWFDDLASTIPVSNGITPAIPATTLQAILTAQNVLSNYIVDKLIDHLMGKASFSAPSLFLALCTAAPGAGDTGATITEANYTGYARTALPAGSFASATSTSSQSSIASNAAISCPTATGGSSVINGIAVLDSATLGAGNLLFWGAGSGATVSSGITPNFASGQISITLANL